MPARAPWPSRARGRSACRFALAQVPSLPAGSFDVVLLLEAMLAFEDKDALARAIATALRPGGRFAFTLEEGSPLTTARAGGDARRRHGLAHPARRAGRVPGAGRARRHAGRRTTADAHRATAQALTAAFAADAAAIAAQIGRRALDELLVAHRLWIEWLDRGRVRKLALVAEHAV